MLIKENSVLFEKSDMFFVKHFGVMYATRKVLEHKAKHATPFVYDTLQLSDLLGIRRKSMFKLSKNVNGHYKRIILKKQNGKKRIIHAPDSALKSVQQVILARILKYIPVSDYATAYIKGKSLANNASAHLGHKYLLKMDITDFFGSITYLQVISAVFNKNRFPVQIGAILTSLCCRNDVLPQGAPTSPAISNIVMKNFDDNVGKWCEENGVTYTRYCDDLTFSSQKPLYNVYVKAFKMLEDMGFEVNRKKTHYITDASRQTVTGLTVNEKVSIPRDYKQNLRQEVYYAIKYGFAESIVHGNKTDFVKNATPDIEKYYNHLRGKIGYVLQIEPQNIWFKEKLKELEQKHNERKRKY